MAVVPVIGLAAAVLYVVAARTYVADLKSVSALAPKVDSGLEPQAA